MVNFKEAAQCGLKATGEFIPSIKKSSFVKPKTVEQEKTRRKREQGTETSLFDQPNKERKLFFVNTSMPLIYFSTTRSDIESTVPVEMTAASFHNKQKSI